MMDVEKRSFFLKKKLDLGKNVFEKLGFLGNLFFRNFEFIENPIGEMMENDDGCGKKVVFL